MKDKGIKLPKIDWKKINKQVEPVLREMENNGIKLDVDSVNKLAKKIEGELVVLEKKIWELAGGDFNINSPVQMAEVLFSKLKLPTVGLKKTKSGFSTAASELKKLEDGHKIIAPILEYRELSKLLSTYLKPLPLLVDKNQRLHTHYGMDTSTGRINSNEPNLQNIPIRGERGSEIRKAFVAEEGNMLISADYSQIELRIVACLAEDEAMQAAFKSGEDIHTRTAAEIFNISADKVTKNQRRIAKTVNFGILYGQSPYGLAQTLGIDQHDAAEYIRKYFEVYKGISDYCTKMIDKAHGDGFVETLFGYTRTLPNINSPYHNVADAEERMAINTPVQGTAAEILKLAMIELSKKLITNRSRLGGAQTGNYHRSSKLLLTIHDELIVEVPEKEAGKVAAIIKNVMENVVTLCVPLEAEVEIGKSWGEMDANDR